MRCRYFHPIAGKHPGVLIWTDVVRPPVPRSARWASNTDAAPAKSSTTMEPETIINKSYIENFVAPQA